MKKLTILFLASLSLVACNSGGTGQNGTMSREFSSNSVNSIGFCEKLIPSEYHKTFKNVDMLSFKMSATIKDVNRGWEINIDGKRLSLEDIKEIDPNDSLYFVVSAINQNILASIITEHHNLVDVSSTGIVPSLISGNYSVTFNYDTKAKVLTGKVTSPLSQQSCSLSEYLERYEPYLPDGSIRYTLATILDENNIRGISGVVDTLSMNWTSSNFNIYKEGEY